MRGEAALVAAWDEAAGEPAWRRPLVLAAALTTVDGEPDVTVDSLADRPLGELAARLAAVGGQLRRSVEAVASCPSCGELLDVEVPVSALPGVAALPDPSPFTVSAAGWRVTARLPTPADLRAAAAAPDEATAERALLSRCVLDALPPGGRAVPVADNAGAGAGEVTGSPLPPASPGDQGVPVAGEAGAGVGERTGGGSPSLPPSSSPGDRVAPVADEAGAGVGEGTGSRSLAAASSPATGRAAPGPGLGPGPVDVAALPAEVIEAVASAMEAKDAAAVLRARLACAACGVEDEFVLDLAAWAWDAVDGHVLALLDDVRRLAAAYGWTEDEVLALGPNRRAFYLEPVP
jgi:hypothetical protein